MRTAVRLAVDVPVLESERLRLRGHRLEDFAASSAMWGDEVVTRYIGGRAFTQEEVWARLLRYLGHWALLGYGYWAVEEKATGTFVGEMGFGDFQRELEPSLNGIPELGWALVTGAHGKGYATEGVRAAIAWGDGHFGARKTACLIHPENAASMRVAEKCGYREWQRTTYKDHEVILYSRG